MDVDLHLAKRVSGIDIILGGHTHDAVPVAVPVKNHAGRTLVINSGANGKFVSLLDMEVRNGKLKDYRYTLVPVFSNLIPADPAMAAYIEKVRKPFAHKLAENLAVTDGLLYRRGTFNGTFDQLILNALMETQNAQIAFSPGFRFGTTLLPGDAITLEDVMAQTGITYPIVTRNEMSGEQIKNILEDLADNRFSENPYLQQGGDMVRVGGMQFSINPNADIGQRIADMNINGKPIQTNKKYVVAGWASMEKLDKGTAVWDAVAGYLRHKKTVRVENINLPKLNLSRPNHGMKKPG
jgi:sulfur-oxidizing protein SoxB